MLKNIYLWTITFITVISEILLIQNHPTKVPQIFVGELSFIIITFGIGLLLDVNGKFD